jgi:hypothetical protein
MAKQIDSTYWPWRRLVLCELVVEKSEPTGDDFRSVRAWFLAVAAMSANREY